MDMKVQGSRSGKVLGIGELLASACSASARQDHRHHHRTKAQGSGSGKVLGIGELLASACSASAPLDRS